MSRQAAVSLFGANWSGDPRWRISYCGIDLAPFRDHADRAAVRSEFNIPAKAFVVGHVGRFDYQKNHKFLIEIFATLARRQPDARLLLIGEGPMRATIEEQVGWAGLRDKVIFAGPRPDVPRLMTAAMDAFVLPSHFEGLPLVLLEAQAAGLPCLLADTVAEETTVNPALVRRLSLSQTTEAWCDELDALCRSLAHAVARRSGSRDRGEPLQHSDRRRSAPRDLSRGGLARRRSAKTASGPSRRRPTVEQQSRPNTNQLANAVEVVATMIAAVTTRRRETSAVPLLQAVFVGLLLVGGLIVPSLDLDAASLVYPLCCLILAHGVWSVLSWAQSRAAGSIATTCS